MIVMQPLPQQQQQLVGQPGPQASNHPPGNPQAPQQPYLPPPPPSGQDWTLSSVLHYLQSEWRRYERDRNEWEIERAEMRARIALLEGERRSFENVKLDFMRRIKMLEYALRVERSKQLQSQSQPSSSIPPSKGHTRGSLSKDDPSVEPSSAQKPGSDNSSPRSEDIPLDPPHGSESGPPLPNGITTHLTQGANSQFFSGRPQSWGNGPPGSQAHSQINNPNIGLGRPPLGRDPKSRARSREYLKQCLQEITYLTSPQAVNPLPNRPLLNISASASAPNLPVSIPNLPSFNIDFAQQAPSVNPQQPQQNQAQPPSQIPPQPPQQQQQPLSGTTQIPVSNGRPRKLVPDVNRDTFISQPPPPPQERTIPTLITIPDSVTETSDPLESDISREKHTEDRDPRLASPPRLSLQQVELDERPKEAEGADRATVSEPLKLSDETQEPTLLTAIFRPDPQWRERARAAQEAQANPEREDGPFLPSGMRSLVSQELLDDVEEDDDMVTGLDNLGDGSNGGPVWKVKRTLRSHLDAVRAMSFHPNELSLATGGDDCTIKIWRVDPGSLTSHVTRPSTDIEPQLTLRAHTSPITSLVYSPSRRLLYSASMDATIRIWLLPHPGRTTYAPFEANIGLAQATLVGHTDAVWDLALVHDETTLVSCGAEGAVKVWDVSENPASVKLKLSWGYHGTGSGNEIPGGPGATSLEAIKTDLRKVAVAYRDCIVKLFDLETGEETSRLNSDISFDGTSATQINEIVSHPTVPLLVTAHEDRYIRIFDIVTGQCTHSMLAHLDAVTSLSIDNSGFTLVSSGHDCSVRFWDLLNTRACIQESTVHRKKAEEGVLDVVFHPGGLPFLASAGADGAVKLYASS